ncbi:hypothetical protein ACIQUQ_14685 [Streptomyces sp. NPDC101118]|uniref:hypothetical protein n=1 Tax=Streptomyces sp. NPDC101118 TaxID=3366109 RepID=UPI0037FF0DCC
MHFKNLLVGGAAGRRRAATGVLSAALLAAGLLVPSADAVPNPATAAAPDAGTGAAGGATLANGDRVERVPGRAGAFRVTGKDGEQPGSYGYLATPGRVEIRPVGEKAPLATTTLATDGTTVTAPSAARTTYAATAAQQVKIDLVNADHWGPSIHVWNRSTWTYYDVAEEQWDDWGTVALPPGDYVTVGLYSNWGRASHFLAKTFTVGSTAQTVLLDAKTSKETRIAVDDTTAARSSAEISYTLPNGSSTGFVGGWGEKVYVNPIALTGLKLNLHEVLDKSGSTGNLPSPYRYDLVHRFTNGVPATPVAQVLKANLATTQTSLRAQDGNSVGRLDSHADMGLNIGGMFIGSQVGVPSKITEYVTPGTAFARALTYGSTHRLDLKTRTLAKGTHPVEIVGAAPFTPRVRYNSTHQSGTFKFTESALHSDAAGNLGKDDAASLQFRIRTGSTTLATSPVQDSGTWQATVPTGHASYTVRVSATRHGAQGRLSSRVWTDWTMTGAALAAQSGLPVTDPTYKVTGLDWRNQAGTDPVTVSTTLKPRLAGTTATLKSLEFSMDNGVTWTAPALTASGATGSASFTVPATASFVSLRTTGTDSSGGTVSQTVIRAFAGPAAATGERVGDTAISNVVVNDGHPYAPDLSPDATVKVRFTVTDPAGVAAAGAYFHHGTYDRPDGVVPQYWNALCTPATATTATCTAEVAVRPVDELGRNSLAGLWSVTAWAHSKDGSGRVLVTKAGTADLRRMTGFSTTWPPMSVPTGGKYTVKAKLRVLSWISGSNLALPDATVRLEWQKAGSSTWTTVATAKTASDGTVSFTRTATEDGKLRLRHDGTTAYSPADSGTSDIDVY